MDTVTVTPAPVIEQAMKPPRAMVSVGTMPPAPSAYAGKASGLPPAALLRHAADYGAWCQANAAKLKALEAFFWPEGK
ncbi:MULTISPECIES: hypothetical protein [Pantoea]|uniref:Uncharacterized protein n=1 Tax=Candidatus Pantoea gossypiicola TaxID=2608008 RepID=A0AB34CL31_9GAMM|nr:MULTISPECIES: hypothetical protein [Pantoea]KAA5931535.1 hypothetical protein F3I59_05530 [Pantoea sp. VH_8]KAA5936670.1 hypothetical protein F3I58_05560 [Pantoea sp. VH_4]KAA5957759.1 hypothetical protein F3I53_16040 [Pantoea sp. VH_16]KAA5987941.1 hypothetical protein F3I49_05450 [Pantoea sp. M_4]KAA6104682.1 hypothetical protein F3I25_16410 [Pantoea sp. Bo_14]